MAPRLPRRTRDDDDDPDEPVRLDDAAHAWWAQRPVEELWRPRPGPPPEERAERDILAEHFGADWRTSFSVGPDLDEGTALADPDDRPSVGPDLTPPPSAPRADEGSDARASQPPPTTPVGGPGAPAPSAVDPSATDPAATDPPDRGVAEPASAYDALEIEPTASWDEIVAAHRAMARLHHPDRVAAEGPDAVAAAEARIRVVNAAYAELRIRRGR